MAKEFEFGDFAQIEMKRHVGNNELYAHKVIKQFKSNKYVDIPVQSPATETIHDETVEVISCICCGLQETEVLKYKLEDVTSKNQ